MATTTSEADHADLYPLLWTLPDSLVLAIAGNSVTAWNPYDMSEMALPSVPNNQQLLYPASGASAILPLTPANNYTATVIGCGGINVANVDANWCVRSLRPALTGQGQHARQRLGLSGEHRLQHLDVPGPQLAMGRLGPPARGSRHGRADASVRGHCSGRTDPRSPDGTLFLANGVGQGTAGYGS